MGVGQVRYVVATGSALVPSLAPYLQRRLLSLNSMLLAMLGLLQGGVWLQDDSIHSATQRVVSPLGKRVHNRGWSHCMLLLLPRLRHLPLRMQGLSTREMTGEFQSQTERMEMSSLTRAQCSISVYTCPLRLGEKTCLDRRT